MRVSLVDEPDRGLINRFQRQSTFWCVASARQAANRLKWNLHLEFWT